MKKPIPLFCLLSLLVSLASMPVNAAGSEAGVDAIAPIAWEKSGYRVDGRMRSPDAHGPETSSKAGVVPEPDLPVLIGTAGLMLLLLRRRS